jgi:hypothetical protein
LKELIFSQNHRNKFWDKKYLEIQSYLGVKRVLSVGNLLKTYVHQTVARANLINADIWKKYYYKLLVEDHKEFLEKNEHLLEKVIGNVN